MVGDRWAHAPNTESADSPLSSGARHHGDFHNDPATLKSTLARILADDRAGTALVRAAAVRRNVSASVVRTRREQVDTASRA
jgi:hypothetical protein